MPSPTPVSRRPLCPGRPRTASTCSALSLLGMTAAACGGSVTAAPGEGGGGTSGGQATVVTASGSGSVVASGVTTTAATSGVTTGGGEGGSGGQGGGGPAPPFRNPVDLADEALAIRALQLLGADVPGAEDGCVPCHSLTAGKLRSWEGTTNAVLEACLTDLDVTTQASAEAMLTCVRDASGLPGSKFATHPLGFWAAGARRAWWAYTFDKAYPVDGAARRAAFVDQVQMPPTGTQTLTAAEYDVVGEWFVRGAPLLEELLDEEPPTGACEPSIDPVVADHVAAMATSGWRAANASDGMLMFGCVGAATARDCLAGEADADPSWVVPGRGTLKELHVTDYPSSYWTRSSADGRFVAHGVWAFDVTAAVIDLQADATIPVDALYDPGFFPNDAGFVFQGGPRNVCAMSVLAGPPASVSMTEPACSSLDEVGLYQHVGATLGGGDYFAVSGPFVSDDGGHFPTLENPTADFGQNSGAYLTPMVFGGATFSARDTIPIATPREGDAVLSPSARLLVSRVAGPGGAQNGFALRAVEATPNGQGSYDVSAPTVGRYCLAGGKPAFSYDERWMVLHHYVEATTEEAQALGFTGLDDPGFAPYAQAGAANVILVDLATGEEARITHMAPGQYALFPHFRSDGWIYFMVRTANAETEAVVASDAALVAEGL